MHCSTVNEVSGEEAGIFKRAHVAIISGESTDSASANSLTLNLALLKTISFNLTFTLCALFYLLAMCGSRNFEIDFMIDDNKLRFTLQEVVSYIVQRM